MSVIEIGRFVQDTGTSVTSVVVPVTTGLSAGMLVASVQAHGGTAGKTFSAVDSKGNTWTSRILNEDVPTNNRLCMLTAPVTTALVSGDTITITVSQSRATWCIIVVGASDATGVDTGVLKNASGTGTAADTGSTGTAAQANQYAIGAVAWSGAFTATAGSGYTALSPADAPTAARHLAVESLAATTVAARDAAATLSSSTAWAAGVVSLNYTPAVVDTGWRIPDGVGGWKTAQALTPDGAGGWTA